jgi:hypothetical protein
MPIATPTVSATQSPMSALRLNTGCTSSMRPPKALAPMNTANSPRRSVRASGKASAAKAMKCTSLSLPSGAGGGASRGQSMATVRVMPTKAVRGMSRYFRMVPAYRDASPKTSGALAMMSEMHYVQLLMCSDKLNICVIKIINNLLNKYDNYTGKYKILLNFFNEVTTQVKD